MREGIARCIEKCDWNGAMKELPSLLVHHEFDEDVAALASSVLVGANDIERARDFIAKGLRINHRNHTLWLLLGRSYERSNINQAYLCFENALFYCKDENDIKGIRERIEEVKQAEGFCVKKSAIVILSYNSLQFTRACIESIRHTCLSEAYEIIVVDNASTDGSVSWLMEQPDIKLKCNSENVGFPSGCNQGIRMAEKDSDIFLLNNDTIMSDNALFWLRMGLYENERVGAAGSVSNYVSNLQQVTWNCNSVEEFLGAAQRNNLPQKNPYVKKNWLIGFALLLKRHCLEKMGYLDERFTPGQYEDNDIGLRLGEAGYELLLCKNSFVLHFGSGGGKNIEKWSRLMRENLIKVQEKWGFEFNEYIYPDLYLLNKAEHYGNKAIKALHIGSGIGATLLALKDGHPNAAVYGIEENEKMIRVTPKNLKVYQSGIFAEEIPFEKAFFDVIICGKPYDDAADRTGFTKRAMEYLKPGGRFITHGANIVKRIGGEGGNLPLVSVIMPCYNHEAYVGDAIESILNQTYPNIELIVADNGSTDRSFEVINRYKDRIKILRLEKNHRILCAKMMIEAASGEYIAQATSDDDWMPEKVERQMDAFFSNPDLQGCFTWALYADENMQVLSDQGNNVFLARNSSREEWLKRFIYAGNCLCFPSFLAKKDSFIYVFNMYRGYMQLPDFYQWVLLLQRGEIYIVEEPMVKFRWHVNGDNRNESAPSMETSIRTNQEYLEIVLLILESIDDQFFKSAFQDELVKGDAENHQEMLCEKFFLLRRMAERSLLFSDIMISFYHGHYWEMENTLDTVYEFSYEDASGLFARSGLAYALEQLRREKMLNGMLGTYINSYKDIAEALSKEVYCGSFSKDVAWEIFSMMPEEERNGLGNLHELCVSVLKMTAKNKEAESDAYFDIVQLIQKLCSLMENLQKQTRLLGIMCDEEEFPLFKELVELAAGNRIDLQEAVVPYIQIIAGQLGEVIDSCE